MGINSHDFINFTARYLEQFLKGLSLCGVIGNYTVQFLEVTNFTAKEEANLQGYLIQHLSNLQILLKNVSTNALRHKGSEILHLNDSGLEHEVELATSSKCIKLKDNIIFEGNRCTKPNQGSMDVFETYFTCSDSALNNSKLVKKDLILKGEYDQPLKPKTETPIYETPQDLPQVPDPINSHLQKIYTIQLRETNGTTQTFKELTLKNENSQTHLIENQIKSHKQKKGKDSNGAIFSGDSSGHECKGTYSDSHQKKEQFTICASLPTKLLDVTVQDDAILPVNNSAETHKLPLIKPKRIRQANRELRGVKSVAKTSRTIFADIVKLGPNDLNGHPWCEFCEKEFPSAGSLKRHLTSSHTKVLWCHTCLKRVNSKEEMKKHILEHHVDLPNVCLICGKSFKSQPSLHRHMGVHKGSRGTACEICGQTFSRSEYHKEHMRIHTGERPFECKVCHKKFSKSSNLATHMVVHKPPSEGHLCSLCYKVFGRQDKLKEHTMRHLDIKRFICKLCPKAYSEKRDLTKHLNKIHLPLDAKGTAIK